MQGGEKIINVVLTIHTGLTGDAAVAESVPKMQLPRPLQTLYFT